MKSKFWGKWSHAPKWANDCFFCVSVCKCVCYWTLTDIFWHNRRHSNNHLEKVQGFYTTLTQIHTILIKYKTFIYSFCYLLHRYVIFFVSSSLFQGATQYQQPQQLSTTDSIFCFIVILLPLLLYHGYINWSFRFFSVIKSICLWFEFSVLASSRFDCMAVTHQNARNFSIIAI